MTPEISDSRAWVGSSLPPSGRRKGTAAVDRKAVNQPQGKASQVGSQWINRAFPGTAGLGAAPNAATGTGNTKGGGFVLENPDFNPIPLLQGFIILNSLMVVCLNFLTWKMEIIITAPTSLGWCED